MNEKSSSASKRLSFVFNYLIAVCAFLFAAPFLWFFILAIYLNDRQSPFYIANRVGKKGRSFRLVKLRSMIVGADRTGVDSTSSSDSRITAIGHLIRRYKIDEFAQLWNVLKGDMNLVGPRPNVKKETDLYSDEERKLLNIEPGLTDLASIVFSDENDILKDCENPDISYNQLIRPWKSRLGILYVENRKPSLDIRLICLTAVALISRKRGLKGVNKILRKMNAPEDVIAVSKRTGKLVPCPPPGQSRIVTSR